MLLISIASFGLLTFNTPLAINAKTKITLGNPQEELYPDSKFAEHHHKNKFTFLEHRIDKNINILQGKAQQNDYNQNDIGNMNKFITKRAPYRYTQIGGNTRDLGGYPTANHKYQTKVDKIIRSADLHGISKTGIKDLQKLNINKL